MKIGIQPDLIGTESYSDKWTEYLQSRDIEVQRINLYANDAFDQASQCDGIMWRWAHNPNDKQSAQRLLYAIENVLHIPVFPDNSSAWHFDEKVAQFFLLKCLNSPIPDSWVFWKENEALSWAQTAKYPLIFKLSSGAGSANVLKIDDSSEAQQIIHKMFTSGIFPYTENEYKWILPFPRSKGDILSLAHRIKCSCAYFFKNEFPPLPSTVFWKPEFGYAYFQEYLAGNNCDTRITVIGNRAFGFRRMNRPNDFRASGSGLIDHDPSKIDPRCIQIAFDTSKKIHAQSMAYDFLYKNGEPVIVEISYTFADSAVHACPGHWDKNLNWIEGNLWPEEAQAEDFVQLVSAKMHSQ